MAELIPGAANDAFPEVNPTLSWQGGQDNGNDHRAATVDTAIDLSVA